jgi:TonB family protein
MRYSGRFGIVACLICNTLLFARSNSFSAGQNQQKTPSTASSQSQVPNGYQPASTSSAGGTAVGLAKTCSEKNPPPCATPPRPVFSPPPEYSSKARNAHYQGVCTLGVIVETNGRASDIRVLSSLGMGLDEKAIEAVKHWKFKPAMQDGKLVRVEIAVEIAFHLYAGGTH